MPDVVGVRFRNCGKIYDFEANGLEVNVGDHVVVESVFGLGIGNVVVGQHSIEKPEQELKKILHLATEEELKQKSDNEAFEKETRDFCLERIMARGIPMKLICTEVTLDRKRIVFFFTADGRIDFRELVKDLAAKFKTRIEMRQIGVRDKAKLVGGLGTCGKELCCRLFLTTFEPISIKMAKQQELVLNTGKLSGVCGRLMCCLGYEYDDFQDGVSPISNAATISISDEDELLEVVTVEPESSSQETVCCTAEASAEKQEPRVDKPDQQKKISGSSRRKKRRRRRRKQKFHKK